MQVIVWGGKKKYQVLIKSTLQKDLKTKIASKYVLRCQEQPDIPNYLPK